jgi:hypothetical protein
VAWPFGYSNFARTESVKSLSYGGNENWMSIDRSVGTEFDEIRFQKNSFSSYVDLVLNQDSPNDRCQISGI